MTPIPVPKPNRLPIPEKVFGNCWKTLWFKSHDLVVTPRRVICSRCGTLFRYPRDGKWKICDSGDHIVRVG